MKIQYASDLHLEDADNWAHWLSHPMTVEGDILVLAGDILVLGRKCDAWDKFMDWCSSNFAHTFIVPGNHEFYDGFDISDTLDGWEMQVRPNVKFLNNTSVVIGDTELFFTTLWACVPLESEPMVNKYMQECKTGCYGGRPFRACDYTCVHNVCRSWLDGAIAASRARHKVVVTHHCPVRAEDPRYESNGLSCAFVNAMESHVEACGADAWVFGHTHYNGARGTLLGQTVMCPNQLGYASHGVCAGYKDACVIEPHLP